MLDSYPCFRGGVDANKARNQVTESLPVTCPYCGEAAELDVDEAGGSRQAFVQDCPVCCRPWQVEIVRDRGGHWKAILRTEDE